MSEKTRTTQLYSRPATPECPTQSSAMFKMPLRRTDLAELKQLYTGRCVRQEDVGYYIRRVGHSGRQYQRPNLQIHVPEMIIPTQHGKAVSFCQGFIMPELASFMRIPHPQVGFLFLRTCRVVRENVNSNKYDVLHGDLCDPADASYVVIITGLESSATFPQLESDDLVHPLNLWQGREYHYRLYRRDCYVYDNRINYYAVPIGLRYPASENESPCTMRDCTRSRTEVVRIANQYLGITDSAPTLFGESDILCGMSPAQHEELVDLLTGSTYQDRLMSAMRFYLLVATLKDKIRSGMDAKHWNITAKRLESAAEHCFKTCILAISIYSVQAARYAGVNLYRVIMMIVLREIGEAAIGDITPFDNVTPVEKAQIEAQAVVDVIGDLTIRERLAAFFTEFETHFSEDAKFAHLCDKLESDLQAKLYQDQGYFHPLGQEGNDFITHNPTAQKIIAQGAQDPFDVWYEYDKHHYQDESLFADLLDFAKDCDLADLLVDFMAPLSKNS